MCGFAVLASLQGKTVDQLAVERMTACIEHRGPDAQGTYLSKSVGFGFRRLSILDLSEAGQQPMHSADGRYVMVYNGEIFNFVELRRELRRLGHEFRSTGDSEVLLQAYIEWGEGCLSRLNGMWAFAIYDKRDDSLFIARDRFGVKPLYVYRNSDWMVLGSEIKVILESGVYERQTDWQVAAKFLVDGRLDDTEDTFFKEIRQFPSGSYMRVRAGLNYESHKNWRIPQRPAVQERDRSEEYARLFESSVELRLRSDVPLGVLLSGGLDSTAIICSAARLKESAGGESAEILAFSYNTEEYDESEFISATVEQTNADLKRLTTNPESLWSSLDEMLWHHDEPVHSATALIGYKLLELAASSNIKVVLCGQGADEALAGYSSYFSNYWYSLLQRGRIRMFHSELRKFCEQFGQSTSLLARQTYSSLLKSQFSRLALYRWLARIRRRREMDARNWFTRDFLDFMPTEDEGPWSLSLDSALRSSVESAPLPLYLRIEDRNSMAHSVEARLPFMDYRLMSLAFELQDDQKISGHWNKFVLRKAMRGRIPEIVRNRPEKFGFPTPVDQWFRGALKQPMLDILESRQFKESGIFNASKIRKDFDEHQNGSQSIGSELFAIAQFLQWQKTMAAEPLNG